MMGAGVGAVQTRGSAGTMWARVRQRVCYGAVGSVADERRGGGLLELYVQPQTAN